MSDEQQDNPEYQATADAERREQERAELDQETYERVPGWDLEQRVSEAKSEADEEIAGQVKARQQYLELQQRISEAEQAATSWAQNAAKGDQLETEQVEVAHAELEAGLSALDAAQGTPIGGRGPAQDAAVAHFLASLATSALEIRDAIRGMAPGIDALIEAQTAVSEEPYSAHRSED